ncbi:metal tolerance protein 5 isoform X1 [Cinnamomum micranthum f. kanehirae]|uniref:Metal tolerance protein 5 isoform X1 n=1 Tax=Cinnamomum micranthum f. kanehirae TaxID=337451 RepID=A0A443NT58_9MAGN|nr:metal tolerance protein 5 isoform X1 [Cinnamomum micranthum f. kanehirae]
MPDRASIAMDSDDSELLLRESGTSERSWRLNFDGIQRTEPKEKPPRGLHDCLGALGTEDGVAEYYQQQVEMLEGFNEMDTLADRGFLPGMSKEERERTARSERMAIRISNIANMLLFAAKVYASIRSHSLAIIASTLDSLLDLLSGFILWFTAFSMQTPNPYQYPIGKKRMQPLGILVFASVMATLGLQIILESARTLLSDDAEFSLTKEQERWVIDIMLSVTLVKLALVIYCRSFTNEIVKAYAQDHFFDVVTNVIGLVAALLANYINGWIDPVGAIILALYTIRTWSATVLENVNSLVGRSAAPEYLQKLTYLCWNHHKAVRHIDTVRAYTFGSHYFVEVDIVLPSDMPLREAHDIGETLQEKLEQLPEIERAFVHLDYEYTHRPEHAQAHL